MISIKAERYDLPETWGYPFFGVGWTISIYIWKWSYLRYRLTCLWEWVMVSLLMCVAWVITHSIMWKEKFSRRKR